MGVGNWLWSNLAAGAIIAYTSAKGIARAEGAVNGKTAIFGETD